MKSVRRVKKTSAKIITIISFALLVAGAIILFSAIYADLYTVFEQAALRSKWQTASRNTDYKASNISENESSIPTSKKETREKNINIAKNKRPADSSINNTEQTLKPVKHVHIKLGSAFARIEIPRIKLDAIVVEGVDEKRLAMGPGHMEETAWPGEIGNMVISGHRVTHSRPFYNLDQLKIGDPIIIYTKSQKFTYNVVEKKVVKPTDLSVIKPTKNRILTLTTCNPRFSAKTRLIVHAKMYGG